MHKKISLYINNSDYFLLMIFSITLRAVSSPVVSEDVREEVSYRDAYASKNLTIHQ